MRIALFITCFNDTLFPQTGQATVQLLERLGHTIEFSEEQTCCGQMHFNTGYQREALPLIRCFVQTFGQTGVVVTPSASCGLCCKNPKRNTKGGASLFFCRA